MNIGTAAICVAREGVILILSIIADNNLLLEVAISSFLTGS